MRKKNKIIAACILPFFLYMQLPICAEQPKDRTPAPYTKEEFPLWQREIRRFEILTFGALPFVTMLSFWGYDMIRFAQHPNDPRYYPWPAKSPDKAVPFTEKEQLAVFFTAVGISVSIALIDITYRAIKRAAEKKRLERENLFEHDPIQCTPTTIPLEESPPALPDNQTQEQTAHTATTASDASADTSASDAAVSAPETAPVPPVMNAASNR